MNRLNVRVYSRVILFNMDFSVILYTGTVTYMGSICLNIHLIMSTIYSRCKTTLLYLTLKQSLDMHLALMGYVIIKNCKSYQRMSLSGDCWLVGFMVLNATFNNISVISWQSVLLVEETRGPGENHRPVTMHWQTLSHNVAHISLIEVWSHNISGDGHWLHR